MGRLWRARARENSLGHYCKVRGSPLAIYQAAGGTERCATKRKKKKKNYRSVQCNLLWLLQQLSAITILGSGRIWLLNSKGESMLRSLENKHELSMRQSLLLPRLTSNWLCSWGWPWTSLFFFLHFPLAGVTGMYHYAWFYLVVGSEARTSHILGKHAPNLSYSPGREHHLSGLQRQEAAKRPIWLILCPEPRQDQPCLVEAGHWIKLHDLKTWTWVLSMVSLIKTHHSECGHEYLLCNPFDNSHNLMLPVSWTHEAKKDKHSLGWFETFCLRSSG